MLGMPGMPALMTAMGTLGLLDVLGCVRYAGYVGFVPLLSFGRSSSVHVSGRSPWLRLAEHHLKCRMAFCQS